MPLQAAGDASAGADLVWVHVDGGDPGCQAWLRERSGLSETVVEALTALETRPRATPIDDGVIVNLRGVNAMPDATPEDLVSIRCWAEAGRVVSLKYRPMSALADMRECMREGRVRDPGDFIAGLAEVLTMRLDPVIARLGDTLDDLEEDVFDGRLQMRSALARVRRNAIELRRFIAPQREALARLSIATFAWLTDEDRMHLREAADRVTRMAEELDAVRERAGVLADQLTDLRAEQMNQRTLVLSVVASVFLPLTFLTGLLGMNVGGIPGSTSPVAFAAISVGCFVLGLALMLFFRRTGWFSAR